MSARILTQKHQRPCKINYFRKSYIRNSLESVACHYEGNTQVHFPHTIFKELKKNLPKSDFSWSCIKMCWMVQSQLFDDEIIARWKTSLKHCWWSFRQEIIPYDKIRSLSAGLYQNFNQFDFLKYCIACWFLLISQVLNFQKIDIFKNFIFFKMKNYENCEMENI